jgi:hypothetical protein
VVQDERGEEDLQQCCEGICGQSRSG